MADIKKKLVDGAGLQAAMGIMADFADKGVRGAIGGYNQSFPLTAATKGNIYYHKGTNRYYICVDNYNGSSLTNPNSKFEELSVYTNRQRLDNLPEMIQAGTDAFAKPSVGDTFHIKFNKKFKKIPTVVVGKYGYNTSTLVKCDFLISNVTTTGFDITIIDNISNHSPTIYWVALNQIIKCKEIYLKNNERCTFDEPFPNRCLFVSISDLADGQSTIRGQATRDIDSTGFTFLTTTTTNDSVGYLAIGY